MIELWDMFMYLLDNWGRLWVCEFYLEEES